MEGSAGQGYTDVKAKRREITSVFIAFLTAVAYQEMVIPIREAVQSRGVDWPLVALFIVFFVTTIRFLIGCHLHLTSEQLTRGSGNVWFFDLVFITLEMTLIIFMGGLTSVEESQESPFGFFGLLNALYVLDVLWVTLQWLMHKALKPWRREAIPWQWALLNSCLLVAMLIVTRCYGDALQSGALIWLVGLNVVGFFIDMFLIDRYDLL